MRVINHIDSFHGPHRFLSNFWACEVRWGELTFPSSEHAYQWTKMDDEAGRAAVIAAPTAGDAKKAAREHAVRPDWEHIKIEVMLDLLRIKFSNQWLRDWLDATGDAELIEGNTWNDTFWGVCRGVGENRLGKLLMQVRIENRAAMRKVA